MDELVRKIRGVINRFHLVEFLDCLEQINLIEDSQLYFDFSEYLFKGVLRRIGHPSLKRYMMAREGNIRPTTDNLSGLLTCLEKTSMDLSVCIAGSVITMTFYDVNRFEGDTVYFKFYCPNLQKKRIGLEEKMDYVFCVKNRRKIDLEFYVPFYEEDRLFLF